MHELILLLDKSYLRFIYIYSNIFIIIIKGKEIYFRL